MKNKIYDYEKKTFKNIINESGKPTYYMKINGNYIEVSKEIYLIYKRSYQKIKYDLRKEVARSVQYFKDIDQATFFISSSKSTQLNTDIYLKDLANFAIQEIYKLPVKYRDIAICIFIEELSERETSNKLSIPKSTVHKRKAKIQKKLQEIIKKSGQL